MKYLQKLKDEIVEKYKKKIEETAPTEAEKTEYETAKKDLEAKEKAVVEPSKSFFFRLFRRRLYLKQVADNKKAKEDFEAAKKKVSSAGLIIEQKEIAVAKLEDEKMGELALFRDMDLTVSKNASVKQKSLLDNEKYSSSCKKISEYIEEMIKINPELLKNAEFMASCVEYDMDLIALDQSNSPEVYKVFLEQYAENCLDDAVLNSMGYRPEEKQKLKENCTNLLAEITNPKEVASGKFKIPHEYIFERLRAAKSPETANYGIDDICEFAYSDYAKFDGVLSQEDGKKLIELYEDKDNYLYVHSVSYDGSKSPEDQSKIVDAVKREGLLIPSEGDLSHTTLNTKDDKSLGLFNFLNYWAGDTSVVVAQIPREEIDGKEPIIGFTDAGPEARGRLLPKYIIGSVKNGQFETNMYLEDNELAQQVARYNYVVSDGTRPQKAKQQTHG